MLNTSTNILSGTTIAVGTNPYGIAVANGYVYVVNEGSNNVSVISTSSNTVLKTITVGSWPMGIVATNGYVYVANNSGNSISIINPATNTVTATVTLAANANPDVLTAYSGYVYTGGIVASAGTGFSTVINTATNAISTTIPINSTSVEGIATSNGKVYATEWNSIITPGTVAYVINTSSKTLSTTVSGLNGPQGITALNCAPAAVTWSTNCGGNVGNLVSGAQWTVTNTASGYYGSVTESCNDGVLTQTNATCTAYTRLYVGQETVPAPLASSTSPRTRLLPPSLPPAAICTASATVAIRPLIPARA